jgi:hypothetical protein
MRKKNSICIITALLSSGLMSYGFGEPNKLEYELRERCGERAEQVWQKEYGRNVINNTDGSQALVNYKSHYNTRLNRCYFFQSSSVIGKKGTSKAERLFDIDENDDYGNSVSSGESSFVFCYVKGKHCSSETAWRDLIKFYMEDD